MKASKESVIRGAKEYIQLEIAQRMTGLNAFAINFLLPSLEKKFSMLYDKCAKDELFSDLFDENGFVDLDALKCRAMDALNASGGKLHLEFLGSEITLGKEAFENIYLCIKSK